MDFDWKPSVEVEVEVNIAVEKEEDEEALFANKQAASKPRKKTLS